MMKLWQNTPVKIMPFMGYGHAHHVRLRGRVLERYTVRDPRDGDNALHNLWNIVRRFNSRELPHVDLNVSLANQTKQVTTNEEGYFYAEFDFEQALAADQYQAQFHFQDDERTAHAVGDILMVPDDAQFVVVSDMDDTVIHSNVPNPVKLVANTIFNNAHTRLPFAGVAEFYRSLQNGTTDSLNPIYYVSNSPYNLYDMLQDFFKVRHIPSGPIFLRDFGMNGPTLALDKDHKERQIQRLMELHPDLPFILIGDSGESDPEIYAKIVEQYPNRVAAIYIRNVRPGKNWKVNTLVQQIAQDIAAHGVDMLLIPDTLAAAQHAHSMGFVTQQCIKDVSAAIQADLPKNPIEAFIDDATT